MRESLVTDLRRRVEAAADEFEPGQLDFRTAEAAVSEWAAIEKIACAAKLRAAARASEVGLDGEQALANSSGVTSGQARKQARLTKKLARKPKTQAAFNRGQLSTTQAEAITDTADVAPESEEPLLALAASGASTSDLLSECERIRRSALDADGSLGARQRAARSLRWWTDAMGMTCLSGRLEPVAGAKLIAELERRSDRTFRTQTRERRPMIDTQEQRRADALMELVGAGGGKARGPRTVVQLHASEAAVERGYLEPGEKCETADGTPLPIAAIDDALADPDTRVQHVTFDDHDVRTVSSPTRHIPARLRDALSARGKACAVPGCGNTKGLQLDHAHDFAKGGPTRLDNMRYLCRYHHDLKTRRRYDLVTVEGALVWKPTPRGRAPDSAGAG